jgi:hypothetical protein
MTPKEKARDAYLRRTYGITLDEYKRILAVQEGECFACGYIPGPGKRALNVDHDHKTGLVRGLLCGQCNRALGLIKRDSPEILERLAVFVALPPAGSVVGRREVPKRKPKRRKK